MKMTLLNRLRLCYEILKCKQERHLSTFINGYIAGMKDSNYARGNRI
jgi:hypothetical protein